MADGGAMERYLISNIAGTWLQNHNWFRSLHCFLDFEDFKSRLSVLGTPRWRHPVHKSDLFTAYLLTNNKKRKLLKPACSISRAFGVSSSLMRLPSKRNLRLVTGTPTWEKKSQMCPIWLDVNLIAFVKLIEPARCSFSLACPSGWSASRGSGSRWSPGPPP